MQRRPQAQLTANHKTADQYGTFESGLLAHIFRAEENWVPQEVQTQLDVVPLESGPDCFPVEQARRGSVRTWSKGTRCDLLGDGQDRTVVVTDG
jgi:hypothetical protein